MKLKRTLCCFIAILMLILTTYVPAIAATPNETFKAQNDSQIGTVIIPPVSTSSVVPYSYTMGVASTEFYHSGEVTVSISSGITGHEVTHVGITIVDISTGNKGAVFTVECVNKPIHNTQTYVVNGARQTYRLSGISAGGGDSLTFRATLQSSDSTSVTARYAIIVELFDYS